MGLLGHMVIPHFRWILAVGVHKVKTIQKRHRWMWGSITKCHSWGYALSVTVASKDKYLYGRSGENTRELHQTWLWRTLGTKELGLYPIAMLSW